MAAGYSSSPLTIPLIDRRASQAGAIRMTTSVDVLIIGADASGAAPCPGALMTVARDELLETEPERVTRQFEAGGSLGLSPAEKVERLSQLRRAKVYLSLTASRRKPPRSPASHNPLKPCPSLARWSGSKRRRRKAEPFKSPADTPKCPECCGNPRLLCRGTSVRIHLPPATSLLRTRYLGQRRIRRRESLNFPSMSAFSWP